MFQIKSLRRISRTMMFKCFVGYIAIIIFPTMMFGTWMYHIAMQRLETEFIAQQLLFVSNAASGIETRLLQVEKASESFQFSDALIELIERENAQDKDIMYSYILNIRSLLTDIYLRNPMLQRIHVHSANQRISEILPEFDSYSAMSEAERQLRGGLWAVAEKDGQPLIDYSANLYDKTLVRRIARLKLSCYPDILTSLIQTDSVTAFRLYKDGETLYDSSSTEGTVERLMAEGLRLAEANGNAQEWAVILPNEGMVFCDAYLEKLGARLQMLFKWEPVNTLGTLMSQSFFTLLLLFCAAVNIIFFLTIFSPLNHITQLSQHMRKGALAPYLGRISSDETGELITAYNALVDGTNAMMLTARKSDLLRKNAQIAALQAQIDPHFFYGTLESIRMIAEAANQPLIVDISCAFSALMRYSLSDKRFVHLEEEIDMVRKYIAIQDKRLGNRFNCTWSIDQRLISAVCPSFVLHPLVENAIVHGAARTRKHVLIHIEIQQDESDICLSVTDNGPGIDENRLAEIQQIMEQPDALTQLKSSGNGRGIININSRLRLYYGHHYVIDIKSEPFVLTQVTVRMQKRDSVDDFMRAGEDDLDA